MTLARAFLEIGDRATAAGAAALAHGIQEKAGFLTYHAFESLGGFLCTLRGVTVPGGHRAKLSAFVRVSRQERFGRRVAELATILQSLRNPLLYPRLLAGGQVQRPKDLLTLDQAKRLLGRVVSLLTETRKLLP